MRHCPPRHQSLSLAIALAVGCGGADPLVVAFPPTKPCSLHADVVHPSLLPEHDVRSAVVDGHSNPGAAWVLTVDPDVRGETRYFVHRLAGPLDPGPLEPTPLAFGPNGERESIELVPGPEPGQAWLLRQTKNSSALYVFDRAVGILSERHDIHVLPSPDALVDPEAWTRSLVFVGGQAHLVVAPASNEDPSLTFFLVGFSSDLRIVRSAELTFDAGCGATESWEDDSFCDYTSVPQVEVSAVSSLPTASRATLAVHKVMREVWEQDEDEEEEENAICYAQRSLLRLHDTGSDLLAEWRWMGFSYQGEEGELTVEPLELGVDGFSAFVFTPGQNESLLRLDTADTGVVRYSIPMGNGARLIQLRDQAAMAEIRGSELRAISLAALPDNASPQEWVEGPEAGSAIQLEHAETVLSEPGLERFQTAGVGHLLVRKADGTAMVVDLDCRPGSE